MCSGLSVEHNKKGFLVCLSFIIFFFYHPLLLLYDSILLEMEKSDGITDQVRPPAV